MLVSSYAYFPTLVLGYRRIFIFQMEIAPDDCTAVLRMKRDFNYFLSDSPTDLPNYGCSFLSDKPEAKSQTATSVKTLFGELYRIN